MRTYDVSNDDFQSKSLLHGILNSIVDAIITIDCEGIVEMFNPAAEQLFQYNAQEVIGKNVNMLMPAYIAKEHDQFIKNYLQTGNAKIIGIGREVKGKKKDGSEFPAELAISEVTMKGEKKFTGIIRDVSERKDYEKRLHDQNTLMLETAKFLNAILTTAVDAIITIDDQGNIENFNPAAERMFQYPASEVIGQNVKMLMPQEYAQKHDDYLNNYVQTGEAKIIGKGREVLAMKRNGAVFPIDLSISEMLIDGKQKFAGIVRDISERKKNELELRKSNQELEQFAYIASHDLKEPLRGINNYVTFIFEDYGKDLNEELKEKLLTIQKLTKRLEDFINSLLYYSRVGTVGLNLEDINLNSLLQEVLDTLKITLEEKNVKIIKTDTLPNVKCDRVRVAEIFSNLITNAIKYNRSENIMIEIGCKKETNAKVPVFFVKDNGIGIEDRHFDTVFTIFKRLHGREKYGGGTGAGLTIIKKIVEQHNGKIWLESKPNEGSTFYFTLAEDTKNAKRTNLLQESAIDSIVSSLDTPTEKKGGCPFHPSSSH